MNFFICVIYLKFHQDLTPILTNVEISELYEQDALAQQAQQDREAERHWTRNPIEHSGYLNAARTTAARVQAEEKEGETRTSLQTGDLCMMVVDPDTWRTYKFKVTVPDWSTTNLPTHGPSPSTSHPPAL